VAGRVAVGSAAVAVGGIGVSVAAGGAVGLWQLASKSTATNILMVDNLIIFILLKVVCNKAIDIRSTSKVYW
jgi:hypothetical protein